MKIEDIDRIVLDLLKRIAPEARLDGLQAHLTFRDQFEFDSVDFLNFILHLEKQTGARISEIDYPRLSSLKGCRAYFRASTSDRSCH